MTLFSSVSNGASPDQPPSSFTGANGVVYDPSKSGLVAFRLNPGKGMTFETGGVSKRITCPIDATIDTWPIVVIRNFEYKALTRDGIGEAIYRSGNIVEILGVGSMSLFQSPNGRFL